MDAAAGCRGGLCGMGAAGMETYTGDAMEAEAGCTGCPIGMGAAGMAAWTEWVWSAPVIGAAVRMNMFCDGCICNAALRDWSC